VWPIAWFALFGLVLAGCVLFVVALVRGSTSAWKYLLLALLLLPSVAGVVGFVAFFAGRTKHPAAVAAPTPLGPRPLPPL
jgi:hypothetical protein